MIVSVIVIAAVYVGVRAPHAAFVCPALIAFAFSPPLGLIVAAALAGGVGVHRILAARREDSSQRTEEILASDLVASGVEAGVSFDEAVTVASGFVSAPVSAEMRAMARISHRSRSPEVSGSVIAEMFRLSRRSADTGAPLAAGLRSLSEAERARDAAERIERLERLPVKLLFPLAFLILPGFLLVAVAPALVSGISKLSL